MPGITDILETADLIESRLESVSALDGVEIIVNRQKNLNNVIAQAVAKTAGAAIIIDAVRGEVIERGKLDMTNSYAISLWANPVLRSSTSTPASELLISILGALHGWQPAPRTHPLRKITITGWQITPDENFLIYTVQADLDETIQPIEP